MVHALVDRNGPIVVVLAAVRRIPFDSLVSIPLAVLLTVLLVVLLALLLTVLLTLLLAVLFALLFTVPLAVPFAAALALILLILLAVIGIWQGIGRIIGQFIEPVRVANWPREPGAAPDEITFECSIMAPINSSEMCPHSNHARVYKRPSWCSKAALNRVVKLQQIEHENMLPGRRKVKHLQKHTHETQSLSQW